MAVEILHNADDSEAVFVCTSSEVAFGPVFKGFNASKQAEGFLSWIGHDPRLDTDRKLLELKHEYNIAEYYASDR